MNPRLQKVIDDERDLTLRQVPKTYWAYLAYNSFGDGLGTWTPDREWIVKDIEKFPNGLTYGVVDGRDKTALTEHISNSWKGDGCFCKNKDGNLVPMTEADWEAEWKKWLVTDKLERMSLKK